MIPVIRVAMAAVSAAIGISGTALAAESVPGNGDDPYRPKTVIQERIHQPKHEFRLGLAYLPQDPFYKGYGPDLAYVWHPNEYLSWEVVRVAYFAHLDTEIRRQLAAEFDASKDPYEKVQFLLFSHAQFTPFYGRYTVMNRGVLHQETYFIAGAGLVGWAEAEAARADDTSGGSGGARPGADIGIGFRWYASKKLSLKLEVLDQFVMLSDGSLGTQFLISFTGSFSTPRTARVVREEAR